MNNNNIHINIKNKDLLNYLEKNDTMVSETIQSINNFTTSKSTELQFKLDKAIISSFTTIIEINDNCNKYKYVRRFKFLDIDNSNDNIGTDSDMSCIFEKLFGIISAAEKIRNEKKSIHNVSNNNKNHNMMENDYPNKRQKYLDNQISNTILVVNKKKYIDFTSILSLFTESIGDNNPLEENYVYCNNKLETFSGEDLINSNELIKSFDLIKEEIKDIDNILLNLSNNYFQLEFGFFNIFKVKSNDTPFGKFLNKLWIDNSQSTSHNIIKPYILMLVRKIIMIDMFIKNNKNKNNQNILIQNIIYKDIDIDLELLFLTGNLNLTFGTSKDTSFTGLKLVGEFLKILLIFLCILERTNAIETSVNELRFANVPKNDNFASIIYAIEYSTTDVMTFDDIIEDNDYNKYKSRFKDKNIPFGIKMQLFVDKMKHHLNKYFFNYNLINYNNIFLEKADKIPDALKYLCYDKWKEIGNIASKLKILNDVDSVYTIYNSLILLDLNLD